MRSAQCGVLPNPAGPISIEREALVLAGPPAGSPIDRTRAPCSPRLSCLGRLGLRSELCETAEKRYDASFWILSSGHRRGIDWAREDRAGSAEGRSITARPVFEPGHILSNPQPRQPA